VPSTEGAKRGPVPWLRNRIAQAAGRAAEKMDLDPESALQSAREVLDWSIRHRGPESTMTVNAKGEVAKRLEQLGRYEEAVHLRTDVATHLRLHLGADDPSTLTAEGFQAFDLERLGRNAEALPLFEHVLMGRIDALGPDHELTLLARGWLGCSLRSVGDLPGSRRQLEDAVARYERQGAGDTEACMKTTSHLATTEFQLGQMMETCELRRHILGVRIRTLGPDDLTTLSSLENLANTLEWIDEIDEAEVIYESLLEKRIRLLGADHPETLRTREMLMAIDRDPETDP
jgi:hypothetical protein